MQPIAVSGYVCELMGKEVIARMVSSELDFATARPIAKAQLVESWGFCG